MDRYERTCSAAACGSSAGYTAPSYAFRLPGTDAALASVLSVFPEDAAVVPVFIPRLRGRGRAG